jgi:hypothetical protein
MVDGVAVELSGRRHGVDAFMWIPELRVQVALLVNALHRLQLVPTTATPSEVIFLIVGIVGQFRSRSTEVALVSR